ncbi:RibD family protein [Fulvivirgaceae bacterium BMA10]|uniref:RibD family protein n=1 Tax=Splendidivirga corallicola TaxID=3051826 RepID=A0ABT8KPG7_9BACT|nr:RibD family protein [Fulvivirgaceae bacterium BMA10]
MKVGIELIWSSLLELKQKLKLLDKPFLHAVIHYYKNGDFEITINESEKVEDKAQCLVISTSESIGLKGEHLFFLSNNLLDIQVASCRYFGEEQINFLKLYLPYVILPIRAKKMKRAVAISHFAQSLDGKIATIDGESKWIGNQENLIHAHRMRALCDGILIGNHTLKNDDPALTVREVKGEDPIKIVVGNSDLPNFRKLSRNNGKVIYITSRGDIRSNGIQVIHTADKNGEILCEMMLRKLYQQGIDTVYIEGGAVTASNFLKEQAIDIVQLHIAPLIMGSGITNFSLPEIKSIDDSIAFKKFHFTPVGDHIMFTGEVIRT